jgi:hypothetical protein
MFKKKKKRFPCSEMLREMERKFAERKKLKSRKTEMNAC